MFVRKWVVSVVLGMAMGVTASSAADKAAPFSDDVFVKKAATGGKLEVDLGKVASTQAASADVKRFGGRMVTDHTKAGEELAEAARSAGLTIPTALTKRQQKMVDDLSKLSGAAFDKAYMSGMVKDHKEDVALFERAAKEATNPKLKELAAKTLPTLREHLKMAEKINDGLK